MRQFDEVIAVFDPLNPSTLRAEVRQFIGKQYRWQALWQIDRGEFAGYWAMSNMTDPAMHWWAPACDLKIIHNVAYLRAAS